MTDHTVTSTRQAARLAGVGHSTIYRWMDSGRLPGRPPWTVAEVKDAAASGSASQRGPREPHGTLTRYRRGCDCTACLVANAAAKHEPPDVHELAPELEPLLVDLAAGTLYAEALAAHGLTRQKITALRRVPVIAAALDVALMLGRDPNRDHGTPGTWRAGCRCPDCRTYHDAARAS